MRIFLIGFMGSGKTYWAKQLDKIEMTAIQLSNRKGYLECKYLNDRVEIGGQGKLYLIGEIFLK